VGCLDAEAWVVRGPGEEDGEVFWAKSRQGCVNWMEEVRRAVGARDTKGGRGGMVRTIILVSN
jgi:hypothetical protein